jgi:hypothetical protein
MTEEIVAHPAVELEAAGQEALAVAVLEQVELAVELAALIAEQEGEHRVLEPLEREVVEAPLAELGIDRKHTVAKRGRAGTTAPAELVVRHLGVDRGDVEQEVERCADLGEHGVGLADRADQVPAPHHLIVFRARRGLGPG